MNTRAEDLPRATRVRRTRMDIWFRALIHRKLSTLRSGSLTVNDAWGRCEFGPGGEPSADITVLDAGFYRALVCGGSLGAARSYLECAWQTSDLVRVFRLFVANTHCGDGMDDGLARLRVWLSRIGHWWRANTRAGSRSNIEEHYDLGNDFFALMLDHSMTYSCGLYADETTGLDEAQAAKLERVCRKLGLRGTHHVLEIGSGWGSFAIHAARHHHCRVTAATISRNQYRLAKRRITEAGLSEQVALLCCDYRDLSGAYDRIVSIEMIEAVGHRFLPVYFGQVSHLLKPGGVALIQVITTPDHRYRQYLRNPDFIQRYVFPGSCCPSPSALMQAVGTTDLEVVHIEDIGAHYARTLRDWRRNFLDNRNRLHELGYSERLTRMWEYYLCYCEAGYEEGYLGNLQIVLRKPGPEPR